MSEEVIQSDPAIIAQCLVGIQRWLKFIIGKTEAEAVEMSDGGPFRVVSRDGCYYACTRDYDQTRLNVEIVDGVVTRAFLG